MQNNTQTRRKYKHINETINGKQYTSAREIAKLTGKTPAQIYTLISRGVHGDDLLSQEKTDTSGTYAPKEITVAGVTYESFKAVADAYDIPVSKLYYLRHQGASNSEIEMEILNSQKSRKYKRKAPKKQVATIETTVELPAPSTAIDKEIDELQAPTIQKQSALVSLLSQIIADYTGTQINISEFENRYDKGLPITVADVLTDTEPTTALAAQIQKTHELEIKLAELTAKIDTLQTESTRNERRFEDAYVSLKEFKEHVTEQLETKRKRWWKR